MRSSSGVAINLLRNDDFHQPIPSGIIGINVIKLLECFFNVNVVFRFRLIGIKLSLVF
jgi:hypothetical protein